jgi:hypothetical protein
MSEWVYSILICILLILIAVLCGYNASTYNKIANENNETLPISPSGARWLMAINIVILVIICPLILYYLYKIVWQPEATLKKVAADLASGGYGYLQRGYQKANTYKPQGLGAYYGTPRAGPMTPRAPMQEIEMGQINSAARANQAAMADLQRAGVYNTSPSGNPFGGM